MEYIDSAPFSITLMPDAKMPKLDSSVEKKNKTNFTSLSNNSKTLVAKSLEISQRNFHRSIFLILSHLHQEDSHELFAIYNTIPKLINLIAENRPRPKIIWLYDERKDLEKTKKYFYSFLLLSHLAKFV